MIVGLCHCRAGCLAGYYRPDRGEGDVRAKLNSLAAVLGGHQ